MDPDWLQDLDEQREGCFGPGEGLRARCAGQAQRLTSGSRVPSLIAGAAHDHVGRDLIHHPGQAFVVRLAFVHHPAALAATETVGPVADADNEVGNAALLAHAASLPVADPVDA